MRVTIVNFILPAMYHVLCILVVIGIAGISVTNSFPAVEQTSPQHQPAPLPEGYVSYPDIGFAYKFHGEYVIHEEARSRCIAEGAQLALIDSTKKIEYVKSQREFSVAHVGIIRSVHDNNTWVAESTGLPVASLPWGVGLPAGDGNCVQIMFYSLKLINFFCDDKSNYVCEIPVPVRNDTLPAN